MAGRLTNAVLAKASYLGSVPEGSVVRMLRNKTLQPSSELLVGRAERVLAMAIAHSNGELSRERKDITFS